jgi:hypothetical protein
MVIRLLFCNIILLSISSYLQAGLCSKVLAERASQKYTQNLKRDFYKEAHSFENLPQGANAKVIKLHLETDEVFVEKHFLYRKERASDKFFLKVKELNAQRNLLGDLVRYKFYERLQKKYELNFSVVERYQSGKETLVTRFVDGMDAFSLSRMMMTEEVVAYNQLVVSIIRASLKEKKIKPEDFMQAIIGVQTEKLVVEVFEKTSNLDSFLKSLEKAEKLELPISIGMNLRNSKKDFSFHALIPENFVYDFDLAKFVMIDPM